jgi:small-conductance mechanosensitive channel
LIPKGRFLHRLLSVLSLVLCLFVAPPLVQVSFAQAPGKAAGEIDVAKQTIDAVDQRLARGDFSDAVLQQLRGQIDPISGQMNAVAAELAPRLAAVKDRLAQLGPKPDDKGGTTEAQAVTDERAAQQKLFDDLDATQKRAKVLAVQAAQVSDMIVGRRRALFARDLFTRSSSLLSPRLWSAVAEEAPDDLGRVTTLAANWGQAAYDGLTPWRRTTLGVLLALLALLYYPAWRIALRLRSRDATAKPSRFLKAVWALRVTAATAAVPVGAVLALGGLVTLFDLPILLQSLGTALTIAVAAVSIGIGLARGLFAPKSPNWRLPPVDDATAKNLYHLTIKATVIVALVHIVEAGNDFIGVGVPVAVATRGLGAAAVLVALGMALRDSWLRRADAERRGPAAQRWSTLLRSAGRALGLALLVSVLVGFIAFAAFLVEQFLAVAGTLALLYVLVNLAEDGFDALTRPQAPAGSGLSAALGLPQARIDQVAILLSGIVKVALYVAAVLLVLAPWRIESGDMLATVEAAFFGFTIGGATISISAVIVSLLLFAIGVACTRGVQRWLETKYLPHTKLDTGLQNSVVTSLGYVGFVFALGLALAYLGLSWERLTLIAGGLSLGIGLGLQTVTNNFVSGLILLWERAVRVGDWVEVGSESGFVRRINVRSTEIETFDRALVIMPNASLMSGVVKNWVRNDRVGRIKLSFTVPLSADPEEVRAALIASAKAHERVLAIPTPTVLFTALGEANMSFDLVCFIEDVESRARVTSDLLYEIHAKLKAAGYVNPPAAPTVSSPALDRLDAWLNQKLAEDRRAAAE